MIIIAGVIIPIQLINNNSFALSGTYYEINYKGMVYNFEAIIAKSELFEYKKYCKYRHSWGEGLLNSSDWDYTNIDRELIESLKYKIDREKKKFHIFPGDRHNLIYSVDVSNESLIYLTYNYDNIIKAEYSNQTEIFAANRCWDYNSNQYTSDWEGNWYLNLTQLPLRYNSYTIAINNSILVRMNLEYHYCCGFACYGDIRMEQFLCFNSKLETVFVYFPFRVYAIT